MAAIETPILPEFQKIKENYEKAQNYNYNELFRYPRFQQQVIQFLRDIKKEREGQPIDEFIHIDFHNVTINSETEDIETVNDHENMIQYLKNDDECINSDVMERFCNLMNKVTPFVFQNTLFYQRVGNYKAVPANRDDIQILYDGPVPNSANLSAVGHWFVVIYKWEENKLYIYDSMPKTQPDQLCLSPTVKSILKRLYPKSSLSNVKFKTPKTVQRPDDQKSCGVFAIANATTLALGHDPCTYPYHIRLPKFGGTGTRYMRDHIARMLDENQLIPFPQP